MSLFPQSQIADFRCLKREIESHDTYKRLKGKKVTRPSTLKTNNVTLGMMNIALESGFKTNQKSQKSVKKDKKDNQQFSNENTNPLNRNRNEGSTTQRANRTHLSIHSGAGNINVNIRGILSQKLGNSSSYSCKRSSLKKKVQNQHLKSFLGIDDSFITNTKSKSRQRNKKIVKSFNLSQYSYGNQDKENAVLTLNTNNGIQKRSAQKSMSYQIQKEKKFKQSSNNKYSKCRFAMQHPKKLNFKSKRRDFDQRSKKLNMTTKYLNHHLTSLKRKKLHFLQKHGSENLSCRSHYSQLNKRSNYVFNSSKAKTQNVTPQNINAHKKNYSQNLEIREILGEITQHFELSSITSVDAKSRTHSTARNKLQSIIKSNINSQQDCYLNREIQASNSRSDPKKSDVLQLIDSVSERQRNKPVLGSRSGNQNNRVKFLVNLTPCQNSSDIKKSKHKNLLSNLTPENIIPQELSKQNKSLIVSMKKSIPSERDCSEIEPVLNFEKTETSLHNRRRSSIRG